MKTTEVNKELIGKRCECIFTGLMVTTYSGAYPFTFR